MSKFLNVRNGNYTITVQPGGEIRLNTGVETGDVVVTGNLRVLGQTTTVESTITTIRDNIIELNKGETGNGVTLVKSGIEIDRGNFPNARLVFDESITWTNPISGAGAWGLEDQNGLTMTLRTNQIHTSGGNLFLINSGNGVISVTGTNNYEENVFVYQGGTVNVNGGPNNNGCIDDDLIPNAKGVAEYLRAFFNTVFQNRIEQGTITPTYVETLDFEVTGLPSFVDIGVDNQSVAQFYDNRIELSDIRISGTQIQSTVSNADLELGAPGTGVVRINDTLELTSTPGPDDTEIDPAQPLDGVRVYSKTQSVGNTGIYFVNSSNNRDEVISNNRALVYSMLF